MPGVLLTKEWQKFVIEWVDWQHDMGLSCNYNNLAVVMREHEEDHWSWEHYIELARIGVTWYNELFNPKLLKQREQLEKLGWEFAFTGRRWQVQKTGIELRFTTLSKALRGANRWMIIASPTP